MALNKNICTSIPLVNEVPGYQAIISNGIDYLINRYNSSTVRKVVSYSNQAYGVTLKLTSTQTESIESLILIDAPSNIGSIIGYQAIINGQSVIAVGTNYNYLDYSYYRYTYNIASINSCPFNYIGIFESIDIAIDYLYNNASIPITYIPINSTLSGPESASSGDTVNVSVSFSDGYIYQENGVQIYNQNGTIPFTYSDGQITFTMP